MRTLVAAGLCASDADARRQCMSRFTLTISRTLEWYLERKAAVLEAGGTLGDVRAACSQGGSMQRSLECVLLWQRSGCAALCLWRIAAFWCVAASRRYVCQSDGAVATEGCPCAGVGSKCHLHSTHTGANLWQVMEQTARAAGCGRGKATCAPRRERRSCAPLQSACRRGTRQRSARSRRTCCEVRPRPVGFSSYTDLNRNNLGSLSGGQCDEELPACLWCRARRRVSSNVLQGKGAAKRAARCFRAFCAPAMDCRIPV